MKNDLQFCIYLVKLSETPPLVHRSTGSLGIKWGLATSHSRSLNSSFIYKLTAEVSSRKILPEKCLWAQLIQKSVCLERKEIWLPAGLHSCRLSAIVQHDVDCKLK